MRERTWEHKSGKRGQEKGGCEGGEQKGEAGEKPEKKNHLDRRKKNQS